MNSSPSTMRIFSMVEGVFFFFYLYKEIITKKSSQRMRCCRESAFGGKQIHPLWRMGLVEESLKEK